MGAQLITYLLYSELTKCHEHTFVIFQRVGDDSDISNCTEAILMNNDVDSSDFPPEVTSTLPNLPFVIPKDEIKKRRDFRKHCVFTIDPLTGNTFWNTIQQNVITSVS